MTNIYREFNSCDHFDDGHMTPVCPPCDACSITIVAVVFVSLFVLRVIAETLV